MSAFDEVIAGSGLPDIEAVRRIAWLAKEAIECIEHGQFDAAWGALQILANDALTELARDESGALEYWPQAQAHADMILIAATKEMPS